MAGIAVVKVKIGGPGSLLSVNLVTSATHVQIPFHILKNEELWLGAEERSVS